MREAPAPPAARRSSGWPGRCLPAVFDAPTTIRPVLEVDLAPAQHPGLTSHPSPDEWHQLRVDRAGRVPRRRLEQTAFLLGIQRAAGVPLVRLKPPAIPCFRHHRAVLYGGGFADASVNHPKFVPPDSRLLALASLGIVRRSDGRRTWLAALVWPVSSASRGPHHEALTGESGCPPW
jgi:hypothetical protein